MRRTILLLGLLSNLGPTAAWAIPAFARAYGVSCSTCHVAVSRRNEFGDAFRRAGYHWPASAAEGEPLAAEPVEGIGASILTTQLPAYVPLALVATMSGSYAFQPDSANPAVLGTPSINLLIGGTLGEYVGFFGTWAGQGAPNELYLAIHQPFSTPMLNFRLGVFEQTTTLFKNNEMILTEYLGGTSAIDGYTLAQGRLGVEAHGSLLPNTYWATGITQEPAVGAPVGWYYSVSQRFGGLSFRGEEPELDLDAEPSPLDDLSVTLNHFGYVGLTEDPTGRDLAHIRRFGLETKIGYGPLSLAGGVLIGWDQLAATFKKSGSIAWIGEASFAVTRWLLPVYTYQYQDSSDRTSAYQQHDLGVIVAIFEDLRGRARFRFSDDGQKNELADLQLLIAF